MMAGANLHIVEDSRGGPDLSVRLRDPTEPSRELKAEAFGLILACYYTWYGRDPAIHNDNPGFRDLIKNELQSFAV